MDYWGFAEGGDAAREMAPGWMAPEGRDGVVAARAAEVVQGGGSFARPDVDGQSFDAPETVATWSAPGVDGELFDTPSEGGGASSGCRTHILAKRQSATARDESCACRSARSESEAGCDCNRGAHAVGMVGAGEPWSAAGGSTKEGDAREGASDRPTDYEVKWPVVRPRIPPVPSPKLFAMPGDSFCCCVTEFEWRTTAMKPQATSWEWVSKVEWRVSEEEKACGYSWHEFQPNHTGVPDDQLPGADGYEEGWDMDEWNDTQTAIRKWERRMGEPLDYQGWGAANRRRDPELTIDDAPRGQFNHHNLVGAFQVRSGCESPDCLDCYSTIHYHPGSGDIYASGGCVPAGAPMPARPDPGDPPMRAADMFEAMSDQSQVGATGPGGTLRFRGSGA